MAHFLFVQAEEISRIPKQEPPIREDPDSNGYEGKILREGLKSEELEIKIKLTSSGNTSEITTGRILGNVAKKLRGEIANKAG